MTEDVADNIQIVTNLDMSSSSFKAAMEGLDAAVAQSASIKTLVSQLAAVAARGCSSPIELALFFGRKPDRSAKSISENQVTIRKIFGEIAKFQLGRRVDRVLLVDCGDGYMNPLSDIAVLSQYLETVAECLETDVETLVYAADFDADHEDGFECIVRDTRSTAFIDHVAAFTRAALSSLCGDLQLQKRSEAQTASESAFDAKVENLLDIHDVSDEGEGEAGRRKVHWLGRAL